MNENLITFTVKSTWVKINDEAVKLKRRSKNLYPHEHNSKILVKRMKSLMAPITSGKDYDSSVREMMSIQEEINSLNYTLHTLGR